MAARGVLRGTGAHGGSAGEGDGSECQRDAAGGGGGAGAVPQGGRDESGGRGWKDCSARIGESFPFPFGPFGPFEGAFRCFDVWLTEFVGSGAVREGGTR